MAGLYQYQPLSSKQSIRLLHLSRSAESDAVVFELSCTELDSKPEYEAVSYTWGDKTRSNAIRHRETGETIYVTANCEAALRALATSTRRTLWMDAICINQNDVVERSQQVKLMARVFRQATRTIAYIGESDSYSASVSAWCAKQQPAASISASPSKKDLTVPGPEKTSTDEYDEWQDVMEDLDHTGPAESMDARQLFERPWFTRTWIIQEVLLARRLLVQAGSDTIDWSWLWELAPGEKGIVDVHHSFSAPSGETKTLEELGRAGKTRSGRRLIRKASLERLWNFNKRRGRPAMSTLLTAECLIDHGHVFDMLCETSNYGCEDPRDKLFAILSLFEGDVPSELEPDYSRSTEEVYTNISRFLLCYGVAKSLSAAKGLKGAKGIPSWAVDWEITPPPAEGMFRSRKQHYRCVPGNDATAWYSAGRCNAGFANDDHDRKTHLIPLGNNGMSIRGICVETRIQLERPTWLEAWRLVYHGYSFDFQDWLERIPGHHDHDRPVCIIRDRRPNKPDNSAKQNLWKDIGFVPLDAQSGDVVVVFIGFRVPFVLRPFSEGKWQLVGECYLPWVMKGQAVEGINWSTAYEEVPPEPLEDFHLY